MARSGTGRHERIDLGGMSGGGGTSAAPEKSAAKPSAKASKRGGSGGGLQMDKMAKIKAAVAVVVILAATAVILNSLGVFDKGAIGGEPLRPLNETEQAEQEKVIQEQQLPPSMRVNQPPPAGAN